MAEGADCAPGITAKKRSTGGARKSRPSQLEKVLGITTASGSGLASDPNTGLVAYPAGCVILFPALHTFQRSLSLGCSGHMPCVRVWEVGGAKVAETQSHNYGVSHVAFSINSQYIVSVGYQHDMTVSVWDWRKGSIIASNKVSSRVFGICFSQDSTEAFSYACFCPCIQVNSAVPLIGRSGLLGDHRNLVFCGVVCGRGHMALSTYCITSSGLLCLFNSSRQLEAWVNLKTSSASSLVASEDFIFCGCADGVVRVFSPSNLQYIATLPRPHTLGVQLIGSEQHR
uniref:Uncharacterized protein n=1 Tax=Takifugu rubripes TaxID=31033 RepID=A0A674PA41_TAKRU